MASMAGASSAASAVGSVIGGYTLEQRLGEGASGVVWRVRDDGGTEYAMKILRETPMFQAAHNNPHNNQGVANVGSAYSEARARLRHEASVLRRIDNPSVSRIADMEFDEATAFIVTEFIDGRTLHDEVQLHGRYEGERLLRLARQLMGAVQAVHAAGVLHRDIKPSNVMIARADQRPILVDFGIARGLGDASLTRAGIVMGTPGFMAPEVIEGAAPSEASDWWSVAAVLAFAATGGAVYGRGDAAVVAERSLRGSPNLTGLPPRLASVLQQALQPDPRQRLTPRELLMGLESALRLANMAVPVQPTRALPPVTGVTATTIPAAAPTTLPLQGASTPTLSTLPPTAAYPTSTAPSATTAYPTTTAHVATTPYPITAAYPTKTTALPARIASGAAVMPSEPLAREYSEYPDRPEYPEYPDREDEQDVEDIAEQRSQTSDHSARASMGALSTCAPWLVGLPAVILAMSMPMLGLALMGALCWGFGVVALAHRAQMVRLTRRGSRSWSDALVGVASLPWQGLRSAALIIRRYIASCLIFYAVILMYCRVAAPIMRQYAGIQPILRPLRLQHLIEDIIANCRQLLLALNPTLPSAPQSAYGWALAVAMALAWAWCLAGRSPQADAAHYSPRGSIVREGAQAALAIALPLRLAMVALWLMLVVFAVVSLAYTPLVDWYPLRAMMLPALVL